MARRSTASVPEPSGQAESVLTRTCTLRGMLPLCPGPGGIILWSLACPAQDFGMVRTVFSQEVRSVKHSQALKEWGREDIIREWVAIERVGGRVGREGWRAPQCMCQWTCCRTCRFWGERWRTRALGANNQEMVCTHRAVTTLAPSRPMADAASQGPVGSGVSDGVSGLGTGAREPLCEPGAEQGPQEARGMGSRGQAVGGVGALLPVSSLGEGVLSGDPERSSRGGPSFTWGL